MKSYVKRIATCVAAAACVITASACTGDSDDKSAFARQRTGIGRKRRGR